MDRIQNELTFYTNQINAIVTRILVDPEFKYAIMNGQRLERLQDYCLSPALIDAIISIEGDSVNKFIYGLHILAKSMGTRNI